MKKSTLLFSLQFMALVIFGQSSPAASDPREILQKSAEFLKSMNLFQDEVAALSKKYQNEGLLVLGLNPFDDPVVRSEEIKKFSARFGVEYPLVFIGKNVAESYLAKTYPTFYLFDKGEMVFAGAGYSPEKMAELEQKIAALLKK